MSIETAIAELSKQLGSKLSTSSSVLDLHGQNESYFAVTPPDAVVFAQSTEDVATAVKICADHDCPIIAWGTGTSLEGHALAFQGGVSLDLMNMDKVLAVNSDDMDVVVQPGVTREALNEELRATGLFFPIDPGANASLGGMTATRASGTTAVRYGTMKDNVLALEVVLADGRIIRTGTRARKSSAGYDLTRLFVGSEGTLGIITEITLKLQGQPESIASAVCEFDDMETAVQTVINTIQMGIPMARIEFVDDISIRGFNMHDGTSFPEKPHLFIEFHGSQDGVKEQSENFGEIVEDMGGANFKWSNSTEERNELWRMRHQSYFAMKSLRPGCNALTTDVCVPISKLAECIIETRKDLDELGLIAPMVGHVGDGNFHSAVLVEPGNEEELKAAQDVAHRMNKRALELGGTVTGEHGVGRGKMKYMAEEHGEALGLMRDIKRSFDPQNILNPGKIVAMN